MKCPHCNQPIILIVKKARKVTNTMRIQKLVCDYYNLPLIEMRSETRKDPVFKVRSVVMYMLKVHAGISLHGIARIIRPQDPQDHSTVLNAINRVKKWLDSDEEFGKQIAELEYRLHRPRSF